MRKTIFIAGIAICIICAALISYGFIKFAQRDAMPARDLTLSEYPKLFGKEAVIVIGDNASQIEKESAEAIAANLENLTGNKPEIISSKKIESFKYTYNLIVIGTPNSNKILEEVCNMTDAIRVTDEYPGEGKGILEILRNPWNEEKAMLLVVGSDEWGVKAGSDILPQNKEITQSKIIVKEDMVDKFNFLPSSYGSEDPIKAAKIALKERYGENWTNKYLILDITVKHPLISFNHTFVRVDPTNFSILVTSERVYFLSLSDFNRFLDTYGNSINKSWSDRDIADLFEIYLKLYGEPISVGGKPVGGGTYERLFTKEHLDELKEWVKGVKEKYDIDPKKFADLELTKKDSHYLLDCYTIKHPVVPIPKSATISHYSVKVGEKGEIYPSLINESYFDMYINKREEEL